MVWGTTVWVFVSGALGVCVYPHRPSSTLVSVDLTVVRTRTVRPGSIREKSEVGKDPASILPSKSVVSLKKKVNKEGSHVFSLKLVVLVLGDS